MPKKIFTKTSSPHIRRGRNKQNIMAYVLIALLPAIGFSLYFFKMDAFIILATSIIVGWVTDVILQIITASNKFRIFNLSAFVTSVLFALTLPPKINLGLVSAGIIFAIAIGKYAFGPGNNIFNPALVGRAFLVVSWPSAMVAYSIDGVSSATPLAGKTSYALSNMFIGNIPGTIGETSALALLIGGLFLIMFDVIDWRIPFFYLLSFSAIAFFTPEGILFNLFAGGLMLGAFFMATDYVTSPLTRRGRIIYGVMLGILTILFRMYSTLPEGVMYSILLMNSVVPIIDRFTKPKPFGYKSLSKTLKKNDGVAGKK